MTSRFRFTCLHEAFHVVAGRTQGLRALRCAISLTHEPVKSRQHRDAAGVTTFPYSRAQMVGQGARAVITYMAGSIGSRMVGDPEWMETSASDFEVVLDALRFTATAYQDLLRQTEQICRDWRGMADRLADYLEIYGELSARKINEIYSYR
jgi:hypothetical protein